MQVEPTFPDCPAVDAQQPPPFKFIRRLAACPIDSKFSAEIRVPPHWVCLRWEDSGPDWARAVSYGIQTFGGEDAVGLTEVCRIAQGASPTSRRGGTPLKSPGGDADFARSVHAVIDAWEGNADPGLVSELRALLLKSGAADGGQIMATPERRGGVGGVADGSPLSYSPEWRGEREEEIDECGVGGGGELGEPSHGRQRTEGGVLESVDERGEGGGVVSMKLEFLKGMSSSEEYYTSAR